MNRATVAGVSVGDGLDVAVVGALNVSPESFYAGSVALDGDRLLRVGEAMARAGAAWLDRAQVRPGMIVRPGPVTDAFDAIGWSWGGDWTGATRDYHHFYLDAKVP